MAFAWFVVRRSTSKFASVCGGRVRSISAVVNRPSLALNPSPLRPFISSGFLYSTAVDQLSSGRMIDFNINSASQLNDIDNDEEREQKGYNVVFPFTAFCRNLDYNLQTAFYKYLETRLNTNTRYFLYEYMVGERKHLLWLKDVKKFLDE